MPETDPPTYAGLITKYRLMKVPLPQPGDPPEDMWYVLDIRDERRLLMVGLGNSESWIMKCSNNQEKKCLKDIASEFALIGATRFRPTD